MRHEGKPQHSYVLKPILSFCHLLLNANPNQFNMCFKTETTSHPWDFSVVANGEDGLPPLVLLSWKDRSFGHFSNPETLRKEFI